MTIAVDMGRKATKIPLKTATKTKKQQQQQTNKKQQQQQQTNTSLICVTRRVMSADLNFKQQCNTPFSDWFFKVKNYPIAKLQ